MMKRLLFMLAFLVSFGFAAVGQESVDPNEEESSNNTEQNETTPQGPLEKSVNLPTEGASLADALGDDVAKVTLSWKFLTVSDWAKINKCFAEKYGGKFYNNVTFFNQVTGKWETRKMYVSDRDASIFRRDPISGDVVGYVNPKLSLVEV